MKRVLLKISYDGTNYHGWQLQKNAVSIASVLQDALYKMLGIKTALTGCSRTDSGVHAKEFYCHFDSPDSVPEKAFVPGLNSLLPPDIAVLEALRVPDDFHARFNALGKTYTYNMYVGINDPFRTRYALRLDNYPDVCLMNDFCANIIGKHDFSAFSSSARTVKTTVRTVTECYAEKDSDEIRLVVTGDGFLYNMVRIIAGTALEVGYGRLSASCANAAFESKDRNALGKTLLPCGLVLSRVYY